MASLAVNTHAVPLGMRVYAIGDIHGRLDLLDQLLEMITADAAALSLEAEPSSSFLATILIADRIAAA